MDIRSFFNSEDPAHAWHRYDQDIADAARLAAHRMTIIYSTPHGRLILRRARFTGSIYQARAGSMGLHANWACAEKDIHRRRTPSRQTARRAHSRKMKRG